MALYACNGAELATLKCRRLARRPTTLAGRCDISASGHDKITEDGPEMNELPERLDYYRKRVHRKVRAHYLAGKHHAGLNAWLGVPVVVTSTIVGTTIFATLSKEPAVEWRIVTGLLAVSAAVLAALQTFFATLRSPKSTESRPEITRHFFAPSICFDFVSQPGKLAILFKHWNDLCRSWTRLSGRA